MALDWPLIITISGLAVPTVVAIAKLFQRVTYIEKSFDEFKEDFSEDIANNRAQNRLEYNDLKTTIDESFEKLSSRITNNYPSNREYDKDIKQINDQISALSKQFSALYQSMINNNGKQ